ncbi:MAG: hypothetical protein AB1Z29_01570 [Desulfobacterales bacterium]
MELNSGSGEVYAIKSNEIKNTYLNLIGHTTYDPEVIEIMKLAALADVQRWYEDGESW